MAERYYPHLPWDDVPVQGDVIDRDRITSEWLDYNSIHADTQITEGIYGPYAVIIRWLTAMDNKKLIADTRVLCVEQTAQA